MGYFSSIQKDYTPSMDASRFSSSGPNPTTGGFSEPSGMFSEQSGVFKSAAGMFQPEGSKQQDRTIALAAKQGMPTALNPDTPPIRSPLASSAIGQPFEKRGKIFGADLSLSPRLYDPGFSIEQLSGRLGML